MARESLRGESVATDDGFTVHATISGAGDQVLIALHGGPGGSGGGYLEPLHRLAGPGRQVVTFDQLGTGKSDVPPPGYEWSVARAVADVDAVRRAVGSARVDLLGHSWGGMLALQYTVDHPDRVNRLVLANTTASSGRITVDVLDQLAGVLPAPEAAEAITADVVRDHGSPAFRAGVAKWLSCFATADPGDLSALTAEALEPGPAGHGLWGSRLWFADGALRGWNVEPRLGEIACPALIVNGGADMSSAEANRVLAAGIRGSEWLTMNNNGHSAFEDRNAAVLLVLVREFLKGWEDE